MSLLKIIRGRNNSNRFGGKGKRGRKGLARCRRKQRQREKNVAATPRREKGSAQKTPRNVPIKKVSPTGGKTLRKKASRFPPPIKKILINGRRKMGKVTDAAPKKGQIGGRSAIRRVSNYTLKGTIIPNSKAKEKGAPVSGTHKDQSNIKKGLG